MPSHALERARRRRASSSVTGAAGVDHPHRPVDDGQGAQAEKVELDQPGGLHIVLVELRHDVRTALFAIERREVGQAFRRDHDASRMLAGVSHEPFERLCEIYDSAHFFVVPVHRREFRFL